MPVRPQKKGNKMMLHNITIVSCGLGPQDLTQAHRQAIDSADVLAGGKRLLDWFPESQAERVIIGKDATQTAQYLIKESENRKAVVLASGDALFYGIASLFVQRLPADEVTILPNITAAQAAFARLGLPWSAARVFSVHGRENTVPWRRILQPFTSVVYCDNIRTAAVVAEKLVENCPGSAERKAAVLQNIGGEGEIIKQDTLANLVDMPHASSEMLVLMPAGNENEGSVTPPLSLGLDDADYAHERNLITHPEVRAVVLAKLRLKPGVFWDLGSASGSVGIEAAGLCDGVRSYCVERDEARVEQITANAQSHGCDNVETVQGEILQKLPELPAPRNVFVGGGGKDISDIVARTMDVMETGGRLVAAAVLAQTQTSLLTVCTEHRIETLEIAVRRGKPLGNSEIMKPDNPVTLFVFEKN